PRTRAWPGTPLTPPGPDGLSHASGTIRASGSTPVSAAPPATTPSGTSPRSSGRSCTTDRSTHRRKDEQMDPVRWDALIAHLASARHNLSQVAPEVYPLTIPHLAATPDQLAAAEARLGHALDPLYRELLGYGNGWPQLVFTGDMLGTDDLGQGPRWDQGQELLDLYYENCDTSQLPERDQLYPIYASQHDLNVMALRKDGPVTDGGHEVIWLYTEINGRWANSLQWWLACIEIINNATAYF